MTRQLKLSFEDKGPVSKLSHEPVLCFPRSLLEELGILQGLHPDDGTLLDQILLSGKDTFIERANAERNQSFKQLIPYVVMRWKDRFLYYVRGKKSDEKRLHSLGSIGIGGHIRITDRGFFDRNIKEIFYAGLKREVAEEVKVKTGHIEKIRGLINDDSNPVGAVHLGVLVIWELNDKKVKKKEQSITSLKFLTLAQLKKYRDSLEAWSQVLIDNWLRD